MGTVKVSKTPAAGRGLARFERADQSLMAVFFGPEEHLPNNCCGNARGDHTTPVTGTHGLLQIIVFVALLSFYFAYFSFCG